MAESKQILHTSNSFLLRDSNGNTDSQSLSMPMRMTAFARKLLLLPPLLSFCYNSGCDVVHNLCSAISQMHSASHLSVYVGSDQRLRGGPTKQVRIQYLRLLIDWRGKKMTEIHRKQKNSFSTMASQLLFHGSCFRKIPTYLRCLQSSTSAHLYVYFKASTWWM